MSFSCLVQEPLNICIELGASFPADRTSRHEYHVQTGKLVLQMAEVFPDQTLHQIALHGLAKVFFAHDQPKSGLTKFCSSREQDERTSGETVVGFGKDPLKIPGF